MWLHAELQGATAHQPMLFKREDDGHFTQWSRLLLSNQRGAGAREAKAKVKNMKEGPHQQAPDITTTEFIVISVPWSRRSSAITQRSS